MKSDIFFSIFILFCVHKYADLETIHRERICFANQTRLKRQDQGSGVTCKLPPHPENGRWTLLNGVGAPGDEIPKNSVLQFECNPGYKLNKVPYLVCNGQWSVSNIPECEKLCPAVFSTPTTTVKCVDKIGNAVKCDEATDESRLTYECIPYYESPVGYRKTIHCLDGTWNFPKPVCQPVCGRKIEKDSVPLIFGGIINEPRDYPWVVAIYQTKNNEWLNVCGGSILSPKVVITAAHCVTNDYGEGLPKQNFKLGAGKYYNRLEDTRDTNAQYTEVARVIVHPGYKGNSRRYIADMALMISKQLFTLNNAIQPICYADVNNIHLHAGDIGVVSGWGVNEDDTASDKLRTLEIPYKYHDICEMELPTEFSQKFTVQDKICAGFHNQSKSVCKGDSGSGLIFKNYDDNRYYIHGIVSLSPRVGNSPCNIQHNSLYTSVGYYYDFIDRVVTKHSISHRCTLPEYPQNGKWAIKDSQKQPGDLVSPNTVLKFECNQGFKLSSNNANIECESAYILPTCEALCPILNFPFGTNLECKNKEGQEISCTDATEGSKLSYTCPNGYKPSTNSSDGILCKANSWGTPKPECRADKTPGASMTLDNLSPRVICTYSSLQSYKGGNPEDFNATMCTHFIYSSIGLWDNGNVRVQDDSLELDNGGKNGLYRRVTDMKKRNPNLKVLLSVGGTVASNASLFSIMAADEHKIPAFLGSSWYFINTYNFDGLDIDWVYPKENEKTIYINLLREVRNKFPRNKWLVTASVHFDPSSKGYDTKTMNELLDFVNIKTYDMYRPQSSVTRQTSALSPSSKETEWEKTHLNFRASASNWLTAGLDRRKMVLTIAFFGRSFTLKDENMHGVHDSVTGPGPGEDGGFLRYSEICQNYLLHPNWTRGWDDEQKNPYLFFKNKWLGYDGKDSAWIKASFIKEKGFFGVNVWPLDGDDVHGRCGVKQVLLKHVHGGLGYTPNWA